MNLNWLSEREFWNLARIQYYFLNTNKRLKKQRTSKKNKSVLKSYKEALNGKINRNL